MKQETMPFSAPIMSQQLLNVQIPVSIPIQVPMQVPAQIPKLGVPGKMPPPFLTPPPTTIPKMPRFDAFPDMQLRFPKNISFSQLRRGKTMYKPSLAAKMFGITTKKTPKYTIGIEIRPMIRKKRGKTRNAIRKHKSKMITRWF